MYRRSVLSGWRWMAAAVVFLGGAGPIWAAEKDGAVPAGGPPVARVPDEGGEAAVAPPALLPDICLHHLNCTIDNNCNSDSQCPANTRCEPDAGPNGWCYVPKNRYVGFSQGSCGGTDVAVRVRVFYQSTRWPQCGPLAGQSCCEPTAFDDPGCDDGGTGCCANVCDEDPFCCEVRWDSLCRDRANNICDLCPAPAACGAGAGSCCSANGTPGCDDAGCCARVCDCDPFCCTSTWDQYCAGTGFGGSGCGAEHLCFLPCIGDGTKVLGWAGPPFTASGDCDVASGTQCKTIARINSSPHYDCWPSIGPGTVNFTDIGDCGISPGRRYRLDAIFDGDDTGILTNYSTPIDIWTQPLYGDVVGATPDSPPDGDRSFKDISSVLKGFQNNASEWLGWLDLRGSAGNPQVPDYSPGGVNFLDIEKAVKGFQSGNYLCGPGDVPTGFCEPWDCPGPCSYPCDP